MKIIDCQTCERPFESTHGRLYCSDVCRGTLKILRCEACKRLFASENAGRIYCDRRDCEWTRRVNAPAVYRFVCPDGRSYVGSVYSHHKRADHGINRSNTRLLAAFEQYPPETWTYEILELLAPGCSLEELRGAEQRHIDRLRSCEPDAGFNIISAWPPKHDSVLSK